MNNKSPASEKVDSPSPPAASVARKEKEEPAQIQHKEEKKLEQTHAEKKNSLPPLKKVREPLVCPSGHVIEESSSRVKRPKETERRKKKESPFFTLDKVVLGMSMCCILIWMLFSSVKLEETKKHEEKAPIFDLLRSESFPKTESITHEERAQRSAGVYDAERIRLQLELYMKRDGLNYLCMHHLSLEKPIKQLCAVQFDPPCSSTSLVDYVSILKYGGERLRVVETSTLQPEKAAEGIRNDRVLVRWRDYETGEFMESYLKRDLSFVFQRISDEFQGIPIV